MVGILSTMPFGGGIGLVVHDDAAGAEVPIAGVADVVARLFLRPIRTIIVPLPFATPAGGIAGMRGGVGRDRRHARC